MLASLKIKGTKVMDNVEDLTQRDGVDQKGEVSPDTGAASDRFFQADRRSTVDSTRRSAETRHGTEEPPSDDGEGATPERRVTPDRRKTIYCITCKTCGPITKIEDWLDLNCESEWSVVLQDIAEDLMEKKLRIMFESLSDREQFLERYFKSRDNH